MPNPFLARCFIARLERETLTPTATARPDDQLVLVVEVTPNRERQSLTVEFIRGADRRDSWERTLSPSTERLVLAYRLRWRDRTDASLRLTCRVRLDGRMIGSPTVLLTPPADAQGRFAAHHDTPMSEPTRLAFLDAFGRLLDRQAENGCPGRVPSNDSV